MSYTEWRIEGGGLIWAVLLLLGIWKLIELVIRIF